MMEATRDLNPLGSTPRIVVLDVETTGKDRNTDQIVELCIQKNLEAPRHTEVWRIKPTCPIHPEAQAVHGITMEALEGCKPFAAYAPVIVEFITAAEVIIGYNIAFDLDVLQAELARARLPPLDLKGKQVVDVLRLWHHVEPRTLAAAHEKFCGSPMVDAHAAAADVGATGNVLTAMIAAFGLTERSWAELAAIADPFPGRTTWIGPSQHLQWNAEGKAVFAFGKHKGTAIADVDAGFLRWVIDKDFPPHVKDICRSALHMVPNRFETWLAMTYPRAT